MVSRSRSRGTRQRCRSIHRHKAYIHTEFCLTKELLLFHSSTNKSRKPLFSLLLLNTGGLLQADSTALPILPSRRRGVPAWRCLPEEGGICCAKCKLAVSAKLRTAVLLHMKIQTKNYFWRHDMHCETVPPAQISVKILQRISAVPAQN